MSVIITLPVRDHINGALRSALDASGIPWAPIYGMSDLPRARSLLLTAAIKRQAERVVCIDADIVATPEDIKRLAAHPRVSPSSAVTGLYSVRSGKAWACQSPDDSTEEDGCRRAEYAGLGFACVSVSSLLAVAATLQPIRDPEAGHWWPLCVPFVAERNGEQEYCADDVSLWRRLERAGTQLWADTTLIVGHHTNVTLMAPIPGL